MTPLQRLLGTAGPIIQAPMAVVQCSAPPTPRWLAQGGLAAAGGQRELAGA